MKEFIKYSDADIVMHYSQDARPDPEKFFMHTHEHCELYCFEGGKGTFKVEGSRYPLERGDILIMRQAESHYIDISPEFPYTRISVHFDPDVFSVVDPSGDLLAPFTERDSGKFNQYKASDFKNDKYRVFIRDMIADGKNRRLQILSGLLPLLYEISVAFAAKKQFPCDESVVNRIINFINCNLAGELTLDWICREFYISKPQLCRVFKNATGSTVWDYITVKRLVSAHALIQSGLPPTRIYTECGFNDYSSFFRAYRKKYGVSPSEGAMVKRKQSLS